MSIETFLLEPRKVMRVEAAQGGGWHVQLTGCEHIIWSAMAPQKAIVCGICAQRVIRQIQKVCAEQAPTPYIKGRGSSEV